MTNGRASAALASMFCAKCETYYMYDPDVPGMCEAPPQPLRALWDTARYWEKQHRHSRQAYLNATDPDEDTKTKMLENARTFREHRESFDVAEEKWNREQQWRLSNGLQATYTPTQT